MQEDELVYNMALPDSQQPGLSAIYRQKGRHTLVESPEPHLKTIRDVIQNTQKLYGHKAGIGRIVVTTSKDEQGNDVEKRDVEEFSYQQIYDNALAVGRAIRDRGLEFKESERGMRFVGIYSQNRLEWYVIDWACGLFGFTVSPLYDTLGKENLAYCIELCGMTTIFVSAKTAKELAKFHQKGSLKTVVSFDPLSAEVTQALEAEGLTVLSYQQLLEEGRQSKTGYADIEVTGEDIFTLCYTSGTTGPPKAAMISNANMMACIAGLQNHTDFVFNQNDSYLSTLPLPHLYERAISITIFYVGAYLVCNSGNMLKLKEQNAAIKATVLVSVPRVYNRIADALRNTIEAMVAGDQQKRPIVEEKVFQGFRQSMGGRVRVAVTGSAPINPTVQQFVQRALGCPFLEGYGQTESPVALLISRKTDTNFGVMQQITSGIELRLEDIPEMKYTANDKDEQGRPTPRGEILARGPQVFKGYYRRPELTKEAIVDDWLHTGDVGEITPELGFKIIDRKKNIFKLQQGEYVAPDKVEQVYLKSKLIDQMFLHGDSKNNFAVGILVVAPARVAQIGAKLGLEGTPEELAAKVEVRASLLGDLNEYARNQGLSGFMLAKNIFIDFGGFAAKGMLTNTMKLIRYEGRTVFKEQIEAMYKEGELKA